MEFDHYLAGLGETDQATLLAARPDVLVEPAPRGFAGLAQRLSSASSLDKATTQPITTLRKGGIGTRELSRLARELSAEPGSNTLWIDLAGAAGLLGEIAEGLTPTTDFPQWRDRRPAQRWAKLALAWHSRPEGGPVRRALLTAEAAR